MFKTELFLIQILIICRLLKCQMQTELSGNGDRITEVDKWIILGGLYVYKLLKMSLKYFICNWHGDGLKVNILSPLPPSPAELSLMFIKWVVSNLQCFFCQHLPSNMSQPNLDKQLHKSKPLAQFLQAFVSVSHLPNLYQEAYSFSPVFLFLFFSLFMVVSWTFSCYFPGWFGTYPKFLLIYTLGPSWKYCCQHNWHPIGTLFRCHLTSIMDASFANWVFLKKENN